MGENEELEELLALVLLGKDALGLAAVLPGGLGALGGPHRRSQPLFLRAHHPQDVPGPALQQHLHAQPPQPLRPADSSSGNGGKNNFNFFIYHQYIFICLISLNRCDQQSAALAMEVKIF